ELCAETARSTRSFGGRGREANHWPPDLETRGRRPRVSRSGGGWLGHPSFPSAPLESPSAETGRRRADGRRRERPVAALRGSGVELGAQRGEARGEVAVLGPEHVDL